MASWSAILAMTGFHYNGIENKITFNNITGNYFWSNGYAYGTIHLADKGGEKHIALEVLNGSLPLSAIEIEGLGELTLENEIILGSGASANYVVR
jgi:hypothetical protein